MQPNNTHTKGQESTYVRLAHLCMYMDSRKQPVKKGFLERGTELCEDEDEDGGEL